MPRGNGCRTVLSSTAIAGIMTLGPWAALPAAAAPAGHPKAAHPQHGAATPSVPAPSSAASDGVGDALVPMFGVGKPTITVEAQAGTFPADSPPDLGGLTLDVTDTTAGSEMTCTVTAGGPGLASCSFPAPVSDNLSVALDPGSTPPDGFLAPAPVTFSIPDCDPSGTGPVICPASVTLELPGTWRPVGLKVTNAATGGPVAGADYLLCEPATSSSSSADCPVGTADVASATTGDDGTLQFPGIYRGSPDYQVVAKSVPSPYVLPGPQVLAVPSITTPAEAGTPFVAAVTLAPKAPLGRRDTATMPEDTSQQVDVLANDSTPVGGLTVQHVTSPAHGKVTVGSNGVLTYTPAIGFVGTDRFGYSTVNDFGGSAHASVNITVTEVAPTLSPVQLDTKENSAVSFDALSRATAAQGNTVHLSAVGTPHHGTAAIGRDGTVTYTPEHDYAGPDSFSYTITDNHGGTATADVTVAVAATPSRPTSSPAPTTTAPTTTAPSSDATPSPTTTEPALADTGASDLPGLLGLGVLLVALGSALLGWTRRRPSRHRL